LYASDYVLLVKVPCGWLREASVSEKHAVNIFSAEVMNHFSPEDGEHQNIIRIITARKTLNLLCLSVHPPMVM
jgi:hypothetical protein